MSKQLQVKRCHFAAARCAFTLIELSIGLTILSLMAAGALTVGGVVVEQQQFVGSNTRVLEAKQALADYFAVNGRLPCPASRTIALGAAGFGTEDINQDGTQDCVQAAQTGTTDTGTVRIGALPVRTLGLRDSAMSDDYGNRIMYAVSEDFTVPASVAAATGQITLQDSGGNNIATAGSANGAVYFVFSTGPDGKGSNRYQSGAAGPTSCSGGMDAENCDNDNVFRDTRFNNGTGAANFFDDMIAWSPKYLLTNSSSSTAASGSNGQVQFNSSGFLAGAANFYWDSANNRVGIGTATPQEALHLASGIMRLGSTGAEGGQMTLMDATGAGGWEMDVIGSGASSTLRIFRDKSSNVTPFFIQADGDVGINTGNPTRSFEVYGTKSNDYVGYFYNYSTHGLLASGDVHGIVGYGRNGNGVLGQNQATGAYGYLGTGSNGVVGEAAGGGTGVYGHSPNGFGVDGRSDTYHGVYGYTAHNGSSYYGMYAAAPNGVYAALARADGYGLVSNGGIWSTNGLSIGSSTNLCFGNAYGCSVRLSDDGYFVDYNDAWNTFQTNNYGMKINGAMIVNGSTWHGQTSLQVQSPGGAVATDWPAWGGGIATWDLLGMSAYFSAYVTRSDKRYKKDIETLDSDAALASIMKLRPVTYHWKDEKMSKNLQYGMIAQEVRDVLPELVTGVETKTQRIGLNYDGFIAPLVASVQTLKKENDALKLRVEAVEKLLKDKGIEIPETSAKPAPDGYAGFDYRGIALMLGGALVGVLLHAGMRRRS